MTAIHSDKNNENSTTFLQQTPSTNTAADLSPESIAKRPTVIKDTGLPLQLLIQLLLKQLQLLNIATIRELSECLALSGGIIQALISEAKSASWIENRQSAHNGQMRYALSSLGIVEANLALLHSGYIGPAPVPLNQYTNIVTLQTSRNIQVTHDMMQDVFKGLMFSEHLISSIGPALNSTKPILIYGVPGVGKSYLCRNLNKLFNDDVLIPSAIEVNGQIIQVYDPQVHTLANPKVELSQTELLCSLDEGFDPRWHLCKRPLLVTGGELTESMLEVNYDDNSHTYKAPLQLKANNGILLLDDLGRQKISPVQLFNRWIIPLEERRDFLFLPNGVHFEIPFELILLFSTNLNPASLVDEAFLRRLGYKIEFEPLDLNHYRELWFTVCDEFNLSCTEEVFNYLVTACHKQSDKAFLPCFPRDLLSIASDYVKFHQLEFKVNSSIIDIAWKHYFVNQTP